MSGSDRRELILRSATWVFARFPHASASISERAQESGGLFLFSKLANAMVSLSFFVVV